MRLIVLIFISMVLAAAQAQDQQVDKSAEAAYAAKAARQGTTTDQAKAKAEQKKDLEEYKGIVKGNLDQIKDMFQKAETAWKDQQYKDAGFFYQSVALATVPGSEEMAETSRGRLIEMEDLDKGHLKAAEDADLQHDPMGEVKELEIVVREFAITSQKDVAQRRLINLKADSNVAAYVAYARAESLEADGKIEEAIDAYFSIAADPRYEHSLPAMKAGKRLAELHGDVAVQERVKANFLFRADKNAPGLLNSAKNYVTNGMPKKAIEKLQTVIDKYPNTLYAADAQKMLGELKK